ncbi:mid1-interacting protein 1-B-like [Boleophthalmus pectinirostris]|uniref:mid1-interacting protein 1-B-like n=1 Tax=Boleophthalmus pectinirostris TaxID=150288 RepID=UPI000A1C3670|nr:mid1-interacting protein 1-B-like [Boleophthalmus pectinirostris]
MQPTESQLSKNSLSLTLRRYSAAVTDMEQTILVPSLLRDVPTDELGDCEETCRDLYDSYQMLKTIRNTVESGLVSIDDRKAAERNMDPSLDMDEERQFHFHLKGLFNLMRHLTIRTRSLTEKYKDIIGVAN